MCVNLYPFEQTVARGDASATRRSIENIDIGGPTMIRAAAKNSAFAAVVVDPADYERRAGRAARVRRAAVAADARSARGQGVRVHRALRRRDLHVVRGARGRRLSRRAGASAYEKVMRAALRREPAPAAPPSTRASARADAPARGRRAAARQGAVVQQPARPQLRTRAGRGVRRARPARSSSTTTRAAARSATAASEAYERAFACDPQSAYGGVIALNRPRRPRVRAKLSASSSSRCCSPRGYDADALEVLQAKKNVRLLELARLAGAGCASVESKPVIGGLLVQDRDDVVSRRASRCTSSARASPARREWQDMLFAWRSAATCAPTRSCSPPAAPPSGSAPAR